MLLKKLLLLFIILLMVWVGYVSYRFLKQKINPYKSLTNFLLLAGACMLILFVLLFLFNWLIISFRGFFLQ